MMEGANFGCPVMRWAAAGKLPRRKLQLGALGALGAREALSRSHQAQNVHSAHKRASNTNNNVLSMTRHAHVEQTHSSCVSADYHGGMSP